MTKNTENETNCRCSNASCGCAIESAEACGCGETCGCARTCSCKGDCGCGASE